MKQTLTLYFILFSITIAHADLTLKIALMGKDGTNSLYGALDRIKGNKIREDQFFAGVNIGSKILNLDTCELFNLMPDKNMPMKTLLNQSMLTNAIPIDVIKDTGGTEIVDGYAAKIYILTNPDGTTNIIWIAKNFPRFEIIKKDLAKRDRLNHEGHIHFSTLPGMPLKCSVDSRKNAPLLQFFINEEPIDDSVFELPNDYHFANTNEAVPTNEQPAK